MTSAMPTGRRLADPLKITSSIRSPRSDLALCSPKAQETASQMFDLPQPLGPTTAVTEPGKGEVDLLVEGLEPGNLDPLEPEHPCSGM